MNGNWTIYKRDPDGTQGELIPDYTELNITWNWKKLSKFVVEGMTTGEISLAVGDSLIFYRNGQFFLGGIISQFETICPSPSSGLKKWKASGEDDTVMFARRIILGDPEDITFEDETNDQCEDHAYNRLIHYINNNCYKGTSYERWFSDLIELPEKRPIGTFGVSAYRTRSLDAALDEIGKEDELYPKLVRDPRTGLVSVTIPEPRDMTDAITISPRYENVTEWKRKDTMPEYNAVWVISGEYSEGRLYVYAEDIESIREYGRIEKTITKSDIYPWEEPEEGEEDPDPDEERLTIANVYDILRAEARTALKEHGVKHTYTIKIAETRDLAFMDDWRVGDKVCCQIDGDEFESLITQAKIEVKKGQETVSPTVGSVERGMFGELFDMIEGLDNRITTAENS